MQTRHPRARALFDDGKIGSSQEKATRPETQGVHFRSVGSKKTL